MRFAVPSAVLLLAAGVAPAGELKVYPQAVSIAGPNRVQQLLVVEEENGRVVADHTAKAVFASSAPAAAKVEAGRVVAAGNGEAMLSATVNGRTITVKFTATAGDPGWSFRNHVLPSLTRTGCNSGACHGALAGKGGLKLSLRGYDPDADHYALTRQAVARRVDLAGRIKACCFRRQPAPSRTPAARGSRRVPSITPSSCSGSRRARPPPRLPIPSWSGSKCSRGRRSSSHGRRFASLSGRFTPTGRSRT